MVRLLLIKGEKSPQNFFLFFLANVASLAGFFLVSMLLSTPFEKCFVSRMQDLKKKGKSEIKCIKAENFRLIFQ